MQISDKIMTAIGLFSGPSTNGVEAAVMRTDGMDVVEPGPVVHYPYPRETKVNIRRAMAAALEGRDGAHIIAKAVDDVTTAHIKAAQRLMEQAHLSRKEVDVIGLHGHTILHRPALSKDTLGRTWQIGSGRIVSDELRLDVIEDFRSEDIAQGGQGRPFTPVYYVALVKQLARDHPVCVLSLDTIATVSFVGQGAALSDMIAFEAGPGTGLVDEWLHLHEGKGDTPEGGIAASGKVDEEAVAMIALTPYVRRSLPKFLSGHEFKLKAIEHLEVEDGAATLCAFSAEAITRATALLPEPPGEWIVCGTGRHNVALLDQLKERLEAPVLTAEEVDWRADHLEAECFAYMAVRSLKKLPLSYPKTTRVPHPLTGGTYQRAPI